MYIRSLYFFPFLFFVLIASSQNKSIQKFILPGYKLLDTLSGDLNLDGKKDLLLVLKSEMEDHVPNPESGELARPLLILIKQNDGSFKQTGRNDNVILCNTCGGVFGDPYSGLAIKNGYFSAEHYGGSNWRWTDIVTFKYDKLKQKWFLSRWGGDSFHTSDPDKKTSEVKTVKDFGVVEFDKFNRK